MAEIKNIIFDLGGVLIDWNPRHLYRKVWPDDESLMEQFLNSVCTGDWNVQMDAGKPMAQAVSELQNSQPPEWHSAIAMWQSRWDEMLGDEITPTVKLLRSLRNNSHYRLFALTNWSAETFPVALSRFTFLHDCFEGIVVSGDIFMAKPERAIFEHTLQRFGLDAGQSLFIDDSAANTQGARVAGLHAIQYRDNEQLLAELRSFGISLPEDELCC